MSYIDKSGYYQEFLRIRSQEPLKPIHKLNEEKEITLCNYCGHVVWLGHIDELYCEDCSIRIMGEVWRELGEEDKDNNEYSDE